jgi:hypothetical protein
MRSSFFSVLRIIGFIILMPTLSMLISLAIFLALMAAFVPNGLATAGVDLAQLKFCMLF